MPLGKFWTEEEKEYLKNNYGIVSTEIIADKLNRTIKAIHREAHRLNLKFPKPKIGDKFGRWTIIEEPFSQLFKGHYRFVAKVKCSCEKSLIKIITLHKLKTGKSKSCGCLRVELCTELIKRVQNKNATLFYQDHPASKGYKKLSLTKFHGIINNAKERDIAVDEDVTIQFLYDLIEKQNWRCELTNIEIGFKTRYNDSIDKNTASLDRIDSFKGYTRENVRWIHKALNGMKWQYSDKLFIDFCTKITLFDGIFLPYDYVFSNHGKMWNGFGDISQWYFNGLVYGAKKRNLEFNINIKEIWTLFLEQNARCAISGIEIFFGINYQTQTASLDRIDNNKGYIIENLQWVNKYINKFRNRLSIEEFKYWCRLIYEYANGIPNGINGL